MIKGDGTHAGTQIAIIVTKNGRTEWGAPHKQESWSEWWKPVAGIDSLTVPSLTRAYWFDLREANFSTHQLT
ncbi:MAG: hypothetical protein M3Y72_00850 [Acidobacteriota bacterium]|nr:hypothetical protein [Acidobacteriota bacterium]